MATHSSILAWRIPWTEEPGVLQSMGSQELDMTEQSNNRAMAFHGTSTAPKRTIWKPGHWGWCGERAICLSRQEFTVRSCEVH